METKEQPKGLKAAHHKRALRFVVMMEHLAAHAGVLEQAREEAIGRILENKRKLLDTTPITSEILDRKDRMDDAAVALDFACSMARILAEECRAGREKAAKFLKAAAHRVMNSTEQERRLSDPAPIRRRILELCESVLGIVAMLNKQEPTAVELEYLRNLLLPPPTAEALAGLPEELRNHVLSSKHPSKPVVDLYEEQIIAKLARKRVRNVTSDVATAAWFHSVLLQEGLGVSERAVSDAIRGIGILPRRRGRIRRRKSRVLKKRPRIMMR